MGKERLKMNENELENNELVCEEEIEEEGWGNEFVTFIPRPEVKQVTVKLKKGQKLIVEQM